MQVTVFCLQLFVMLVSLESFKKPLACHHVKLAIKALIALEIKQQYALHVLLEATLPVQVQLHVLFVIKANIQILVHQCAHLVLKVHTKQEMVSVLALFAVLENSQ